MGTERRQADCVDFITRAVYPTDEVREFAGIYFAADYYGFHEVIAESMPIEKINEYPELWTIIQQRNRYAGKARRLVLAREWE